MGALSPNSPPPPTLVRRMSHLTAQEKDVVTSPIVSPSQELAPSPLLGPLPQPGPSWAPAPGPPLTKGHWFPGGQVGRDIIRARELPRVPEPSGGEPREGTSRWHQALKPKGGSPVIAPCSAWRGPCLPPAQRPPQWKSKGLAGKDLGSNPHMIQAGFCPVRVPSVKWAN